MTLKNTDLHGLYYDFKIETKKIHLYFISLELIRVNLFKSGSSVFYKKGTK